MRVLAALEHRSVHHQRFSHDVLVHLTAAQLCPRRVLDGHTPEAGNERAHFPVQGRHVVALLKAGLALFVEQGGDSDGDVVLSGSDFFV